LKLRTYFTLHPGIRVLSFLLYATILAVQPHLSALFALPVLFLCAYFCPIAATWRALKRLRWLFLSLAVFGLILPLEGYSIAGLSHSMLFTLERIAVLILIVVVAHWLVSHTPPAELIAALDWLLRPLTFLGLPVTRFTVRLSLTLETIQHAQTLYTPHRADTETSRFQYWQRRLSQLFQHSIERAESAPLVILEIPTLPPPSWSQWLLPALIVLSVFLI
jgi:hypothetical protein